jgi:iron complex outermembrane receptor protein
MRNSSSFSLAVVAAALLTPAAMSAQNGSVTGRVLADDGSPVAGAQVSIQGTGLGGLTNVRGAFLIVRVPPGAYTVEVQSIGFETTQASVTVVAGQTVSQTFRLGESAVSVEGVAVTVGSRAVHRAADELAVPVDVYTQSEIIRASPQLEMGTILQELSPAIHMPRAQIADLTSGVRPFQLRGLSPDHSLVLINGKRRHPTAVVHVFGAGTMGSGSSGVDMNAIAPTAIGGMEILRDGAAAQYGSDAIAGVINLQLRDDVHRPELTMALGQYRPSDFAPDGRRVELGGSWGFALGERGTAVVAGMYSDRERTHRAGPDPRDQVALNDADSIADVDGDGVGEIVVKRNGVQQPNHLIGDGLADNGGAFWNVNYDLGEDRIHSLYTFGGYTFRRDVHSGFFRRGIDNRNWPDIHPLGFLPKFRGDAQDLMTVTGIRGFAGDWGYDLSAQWDRNRLDTDIFDSHNVSLGPCLDTPCAPGEDGVLGTEDDPGIPNKTDVFAGSLILNQMITQVDFTRGAELGGLPVHMAFGANFRADNFEIVAGEGASWINGWHPDRSGGIAAPGSQVFTGYRPDQEVNKWRTNVGVYADFESDLTDAFLMAVAGRFERYSDFGSTLNGKLAMRLQASEQFIVRGAVSTGFRAPGLNQGYYSHVSTGFRNDGSGNQVAYEIGEIPVESPEARALGAEPLREETSVNYSAGLAYSPAEQLTLTVDGYLIDVDDRIILSGSLDDPIVASLLAAYGAPTVKFFTNSIDTRTRGLDVTARYRHLIGDDRYLEFLGQYNRNVLEVRGIHVPDVIAEVQDQVFDSGDEFSIENGRPMDRATIRVRYVHGPVTAAIADNFYGVQSSRLQESPDVFLRNGPHRVLDAEVSWDVHERLSLSIGAENVLDANPVVVPEDYSFLGIFPFESSSGLSMNGRYVFSRVSVRF